MTQITMTLTFALAYPWYFNALVRVLYFFVRFGLMSPNTAALALSKTITLKVEQRDV